MKAISTAASCGVILVLAGGCAGKAGEHPISLGSADTGPGTVTAARKYLQGRWTLESFEVRPPGRPPIMLTGEGTLIYDDFSNLQMEIRTDEKTADLLRAAGMDVRDNAISTSGRTAVDMQHRTLTYILEGQEPLVSGGPLAMNRPRYWEVEADVLTLTTKDENGTPLSIGRWRRMP